MQTNTAKWEKTILGYNSVVTGGNEQRSMVAFEIGNNWSKNNNADDGVLLLCSLFIVAGVAATRQRPMRAERSSIGMKDKFYICW